MLVKKWKDTLINAMWRLTLNKEKLSYTSGIEYEIEIENNQVMDDLYNLFKQDVEKQEHKINVYAISKDLVKPLTINQIEENEWYWLKNRWEYIKVVRVLREKIYYKTIGRVDEINVEKAEIFKNKEFAEACLVISHRERKGERYL